MLRKVSPGEPIKASTINDLIDASQTGINGTDSAPMAGKSRQFTSRVLISNPFSRVVLTGEPIPIGGIRNSKEASEAKRLYQTSGCVLEGTTSESKYYAVAIEAIKPGELGWAELPGIVAGMVYYNEDEESGEEQELTNASVSSDGYFESNSSGVWNVIASSQPEDINDVTYSKQKWCFLKQQEKTEGCLILNDSGENLVAGQVLEITKVLQDGKGHELTYNEAKSQYEESGCVLTGIKPTGDSYLNNAVLLADCKSGQVAPCALFGVFGATVVAESSLDLTVGTTPGFLPYATAKEGSTDFIMSRNGLFDRHNRVNSFDYGMGGKREYRVLSRSKVKDSDTYFCYLIYDNSAICCPARILGAIPIAANRWLYTVEELTAGINQTTGLPYFDYRSGGKGFDNRLGWAYNACEPTSQIYPVRTKERITARVPYWDANERLWKQDADAVQITHTVRRAVGCVMLYGDAVQGVYFMQPNQPILEDVILTTDQNAVTTVTPELLAGNAIAFSDGGEASDAEARAQGSGRKCKISWSGGSVGRSDWSRLISGIQEIVFDSTAFQVTIKNNRATIGLK